MKETRDNVEQQITKDLTLTSAEIEEARRQILALRTQIRILETEVSITTDTFVALDCGLNNLLGFVNMCEAIK